MKPISTSLFITVTVLAALCAGMAVYIYGQTTNTFGGVGGPTGVSVTASSTVFALTTSSQRLVATSSKRYATEIDPTYCTSGGTVFLKDGKDAPAVAKTGIAVLASTTRTFTESQSPLSDNSVQGIVDSGTCTVLVTEWRTNN